MWQDFVLILSKILDLYEELLVLSNEKRKILISVDMKALEKIIKREQLLITSVGKLEQRRESVLTELLLSENITAPHSELADLFAFCDVETGKKLQNIHVNLKKTLAALGKSNEGNDVLIRQALSAVNYNLNRLSDARVGPTYADEGKEVISHAKCFDFKA